MIFILAIIGIMIFSTAGTKLYDVKEATEKFKKDSMKDPTAKPDSVIALGCFAAVVGIVEMIAYIVGLKVNVYVSGIMLAVMFLMMPVYLACHKFKWKTAYVILWFLQSMVGISALVFLYIKS